MTLCPWGEQLPLAFLHTLIFSHTFLKYWGLKSPPVPPSSVCTLHIPCDFICSLGFILQPSLITSLSTLSAPVFLSLQSHLPTQLPSGPPPVASSLGLRQSSLPTRVPPNHSHFFIPCGKDRPRPATALGSHSQFSHCHLAHMPSLESVSFSSMLQVRPSLNLLFSNWSCAAHLDCPCTSSPGPLQFILHGHSRVTPHITMFLICELFPWFCIVWWVNASP